jgi:hypothetical protein
MTDIALAVLVLGAVTLALAVDLAALVGWLRGADPVSSRMGKGSAPT